MNVIHCNTTLIPHNQIIYILHMIHMIIYDHICTCIFYDAHTHTSCTWAELRPRTWEMPWPKQRRSWKSSATFASDSAIWTHMLNPWWDKKSGWNSWNMLKPSTSFNQLGEIPWFLVKFNIHLNLHRTTEHHRAMVKSGTELPYATIHVWVV